MRIAMVSEHASPLAALGEADAGGQNVHVAALAEALGRRGSEVVVYTRRDDPDLPTRVRLAPGAVVEHVDAGPPRRVPKDELRPHMGRFGRELRRSLTLEPPDVLHAHFWMSGLAALGALGGDDRPVSAPSLFQTFHALGVVKRRHQGDADTSPDGRIEDERLIARSVDRIVATCSDEVFELIRMGADRRRVSVIPCGVDLDHFTPGGASEARTPGTRRILALARLVQRKGVDDVVQALAHLPDTELVVAGGPEASRIAGDVEAGRLTRLAVELGVADRMQVRGRVERPELPALIRSADVVACVPWYEPFGIVPLEAMACGVPVVASAVGGQIDSVVDGVTGVHVLPRRPERLAEALSALLADPDRRAALGAAGARRARSRYGWDAVASATLDAYRSVATQSGAREREVGA